MPVYFVLCKRVYFDVDVPVQSDALIGVSQLLYITCGVGGGVDTELGKLPIECLFGLYLISEN